jgi:peptidoglycan hydrolase-like amidase
MTYNIPILRSKWKRINPCYNESTMMESFKRGLLMCLVVILLAPLAFRGVLAHAQDAYATEVVSVTNNGNISLAPGAKTTVDLVLKNTGTQAWTNDGTGYISLYTYDPKYRRSNFDPGTWIWWNQAKRLTEANVPVGKQGHLSFELHAPAQEGTYTEVFNLASEDRAWVTGGKITLTIKVAKGAVAQAPATVTPTAPQAASKAEIVAQTVYEIDAKAGAPVSVQVAVKNTGTNTWNGFGILAPTASIASNQPSFADDSWTATHVAFASQIVKPGDTGVLSFIARAPRQNGTHDTSFEIMTDEGRHTGTYANLSIHVTDGAGEAMDTSSQSAEPAIVYGPEPTLRIGAIIVDEETDFEVKVRSNTSGLRVETIDGALLGEVTQGQIVYVAYANGVYTYDLGAGKKTSAQAIRLIPPAITDVLEVANFDRRVTRNSQFADNTFRGTLELRYNAAKDRTWLINELPIELYLRGLAETSNSSPYEYQKAIVTAARSYAYYHATHGTKWNQEFFTMTAYSYDQVYNGYGHEMRSPAVVKAVEETKGIVVTYAGEALATPYFSRSDGRTRSWDEVWNGSRPWAVSVPVPCEKGKTLWGHGVGMSAQGAICMANEGMMGEEILKYFYTGVDLTKTWN